MNRQRIKEALDSMSEGLMRAAIAATTIATEFESPDVQPPVVVDPPKPPVEPPTPRKRIYGWNLGAQNHYEHGKIYNDALAFASRMVDIQWNNPYRPATIDSDGVIVDGDSQTRIWFDARVHGPGSYFGEGTPREVVVPVGSRGLDDKSNDNNFVDVKFSGNTRGMAYTFNWEGRAVNPNLIDKMNGVGVLRFMDLRRTNYDMIPPEASEHRLCCYQRQGQGQFDLVHPTITPEQAIEVATACGAAGIWWNVHFRETDQQVAEAMHVFAEKWAGELYVEWSNENWNAAIEGRWLQQTGERFGADDTKDWLPVYDYFRQRSNEVGKIAKSIVPGVCVVMGTQSASTGVTDNQTRGDLQYIDALGIAPYFGHYLRWPDSTKKLLAATRAQVSESLAQVEAQKTIADKLGKRLLCYEFGSHIWAKQKDIPPAEYQAMMEAVRSDEMAEIYGEFMDGWEQLSGDVACCFTSCDDTSFAHYEFDTSEWQPRGKAVADRMAVGVE